MAQDEFEVISKYFRRSTEDPGVLLGIGDDAAVVNSTSPIAITTDTLVSGVHFPSGISGDVVGHRLLAANLSDLAAMGAKPRWCTLAMTLEEIDEQWLSGFSSGFFNLAEKYDVSVIGGDLTRGPLTVTAQLFGICEEDYVLTRSGGKVGDEIYVTGSLGDSAAGLSIIDDLDVSDEKLFLKNRFLRPVPRVEEGVALRGMASAAIDISDGLLADLGHICNASGCGAVIDLEKIPLSKELCSLYPVEEAHTFALSGGEDFELCFTAPPSKRSAIKEAFKNLDTNAYLVGKLDGQQGLICRREGIPFEPISKGYLHFT